MKNSLKEYTAHFTFYDEQIGTFTETPIKVEASNQFEARQKAWEASEDNDNLKFASCIKLCGITWEASPLDMQDYYNAAASYDKFRIQYIENVEKPNAQIEKIDSGLERWERERYSHFGSLFAIDNIAKDFGQPYGMLPPMIFEELHYAREFLSLIDWREIEKYNALSHVIEQAEKWDRLAVHSITDLFRHGYIRAEGHDFDFAAQFGKEGMFPVHADRSEYASMYIHRWHNEGEHKSLYSLPFFDEKDTVAGSQAMQYDYQALVLRREALPPEAQTPVNSIWQADQGSEGNYDRGGDRPILATNIITEEVAEWKRSDFAGVLRPEKYAKIDIDRMRAEYQGLGEKRSNDKQLKEKAPWIKGEPKKPSILADMKEKQKQIASKTVPAQENVEKKKQQDKSELS